MKLAWVQIIIALALGVAVGVGLSTLKCSKCCSSHCEQASPDERKGKILEKLNTKLGLNEEQKSKVQEAIEKKYEKMKVIKEETRSTIKSVLTEEQSKKFEELIAKCKAFSN